MVMNLKIPTTHNEYRPWRLNTLLLAGKDFVKFISNEIHFFLLHNTTPGMSPSLIWEAMKAYLRGQITSNTSCVVRKNQMRRLEELTKEILKLDAIMARCPSPDVYKRRLLTQAEYNLLSTKHAENMINKIRCRTYQHGEKTERSLAQQLRQKIANQTIAEIKDIHIHHSQINNCFFKLYFKLYTSESPGDEPLLKLFFDKINTPMIDAVNGKSPGPDGFPSKFFRTFAGELALLLLSVYEESYTSGSLPLTMRQVVISLILKRDKNSVECSSYRPISLLNVDCKLLAKILAQRLEKILPSVISDDQTGFIKHRQLFFNTRRLFDILYSPTPPGDTEILLSLDAEKAFDLLYTMKKFELGTRQGCPLSPLLFSLVIERLAILLRSEDMIKEIHRGGLEHKVSLYADEMLLYIYIYISDPMSSLPELLNALNSFSKISGYKINFEKSKLMPINNVNMAAIINQFPFKINTNKFKYLGIWVTHNMKQDFERWNLLPLSLGGRVNIIKMNMAPKFVFLFQNIPLFFNTIFF
uniref:Reverse transcriptase domain-containing protein n=1 Tax=Pygocentrus nattereri TaxID=42514 RepID=A0AAR2L1I6_PYGNA